MFSSSHLIASSPKGVSFAVCHAAPDAPGQIRQAMRTLLPFHALCGVIHTAAADLSLPGGIKDAAFTFITRSPKLHAQSLRTDRWRFTRWSDGRTELYDHETDPVELHEISARHPGVIAELGARLEKLPPLTSKQ